MRKKLCISLAIFTLTLASSITVFAAPEVMPDGGMFDAEYYAQNNPDVVAVFGTDKELLYSHYVNNGRAEGRLPVALEEYNLGGLTGSNGQLDNPSDMAMRQELNSLDKNTVQNTLRSVWLKIATGEYDLSGKEEWELF